MGRSTPTQSQLLAKSRADAALARKQRYRRMIGLALGATGLAGAIAGLPLGFSLCLWAVGAGAWAILKAA